MFVIVPWLKHCTVLMKLTVAVLRCVKLLFYIARQLSTSNFSSILPMQPLTGQIVTHKIVFTWNLETPVNQVAIYWLPGEFKGNLCTAVTLYITVTWPFPKGDRYIQVWLYLEIGVFPWHRTANQPEVGVERVNFGASVLSFSSAR